MALEKITHDHTMACLTIKKCVFKFIYDLRAVHQESVLGQMTPGYDLK